MQDKTNLSSILDELWQRPSERLTLARQFVKELSREDWLVLCGWDFAATFGPVSGTLSLVRPNHIQVRDDWNRVLLGASLVEIADLPNDFLLIKYYGTNLAVTSEGSNFGRDITDICRDPAGLLAAFQLLRDHLDSALLSPKKLRDKKISDFAALCGLEDDHFRRLGSWLSAAHLYL